MRVIIIIIIITKKNYSLLSENCINNNLSLKIRNIRILVFTSQQINVVTLANCGLGLDEIRTV